MGTGRSNSVTLSKQKIKQRIKVLEEELSELRQLEKQADARRVFKCGKCGKGTQLKNLTYTQTYWYERPYSCMAGDTWHTGEGNITCPKCGCRNRLIHEYGESFSKLIHLFRDVEDSKDDDNFRGRMGEDWVNV